MGKRIAQLMSDGDLLDGEGYSDSWWQDVFETVVKPRGPDQGVRPLDAAGRSQVADPGADETAGVSRLGPASVGGNFAAQRARPHVKRIVAA